MLVLAPVWPGTTADIVSADIDPIISALVFDQAEASALGLEFRSFDDSSSSGFHVTASYADPSPGKYSIIFTVTLSRCSSTYDYSLADKTSGCSNCSDPDCGQMELLSGGSVPRRPCFSAYRNGYTDFGVLEGETVFAQGDLLVKVESTTGYSISTEGDYQLSRSQHEWFVDELAAKLDANYLADVMQLTAYAYVATQPTGADVPYAGQDVVIMEGAVTGPNGGVADATIEGFTFAPSLSGWNYATVTDSSGSFRRIMGPAGDVHHITARVRHTDTSPAYAGTLPITIDDFNGQPATTDTGMSIGVSTDKSAYAAGETVLVSGSVADSNGPLPDATVSVDVDGTVIAAALDSAGSFQAPHTLSADTADGVYTVTATATHVDYPDSKATTTFAVGDIGILLEENPASGEPFLGVAADGVSDLTVTLMLPGCADVTATAPAVGELDGGISATGAVQLDPAGQAQLVYHPPAYLSAGQVVETIDVHQSDSKAWVARVPLSFSYTDSAGQPGTVETQLLVCRPPVMLVHGFLGGTATWGKMSTYLRGEQFDTFVGDYSASGPSIEGLSGILQSDIAAQKADYANAGIKLAKVDAVGHSMGGLISRYYANGLPSYSGDLRKLIMVGTPNHGVVWLKKKLGNLGAEWYNTHRIPGEQLYSESPFMKALNAGETTGAHLNPDVQYGNIYGLPDDWVVSAASAYLNGVSAVLQSDVKHSADIPGVPVVAITEYLPTWQQVNAWLTEDIYRPPLKGSHAEVFKYWGDVYIIDHDASGSHETKLQSSPAGIESFQSLRTDSDSRAIVHLTIQGRPWGVIFLDPDSEMLLGYYSPQLVEVTLWQGSATFRSGQEGHYSVPVNIAPTTSGEWWKTTPQAVVRGLDTEFVVAAGDRIRLDCLEGALAVDVGTVPGETLVSGGEAIIVDGETVGATSCAQAEDFWWSSEEDDFLDDSTAEGVFDGLKGLLRQLVDWLKALIG